MLMASTAALPSTIPSVSGVSTPTLHPSSAAIVAASVSDSINHNQKDTTFTKIFVGGLPYHTSDKSLREHFEVFGEIDEAVVITDRQTGKSRGYGFVTMADRSGAERAIKDPNPVIDGRKANVNLAYIGAKPRGSPASSNYSYATSMFANQSAAGGMRLYTQIGASPHISYQPHPAGSYIYNLAYPSAAHIPVLQQTAAHLTPTAATGYTPAEYPGTTGYTTTGYPTTHTVLDPFTMNALSGAGLSPSGYSYLSSAAAAANAASSFALGAAAYQTAGGGPQATLQDARLQ